MTHDADGCSPGCKRAAPGPCSRSCGGRLHGTAGPQLRLIAPDGLEAAQAAARAPQLPAATEDAGAPAPGRQAGAQAAPGGAQLEDLVEPARDLISERVRDFLDREREALVEGLTGDGLEAAQAAARAPQLPAAAEDAGAPAPGRQAGAQAAPGGAQLEDLGSRTWQAAADLRRSEVVDGVLLIPGTRVTPDRVERKGWIGAEPLTRRRLSWGLTKGEALQRAREVLR